MKLPNSERAIVDIAKLRDYCLNSKHPSGRHKARVFRSALGIDPSRAGELRQILLKVAATSDARLAEQDDFGQRYVIDFAWPGASAPVTIRSCWIIRLDEQVPRLTTRFIVTKDQAKP